jgi:hypothetical protein
MRSLLTPHPPPTEAADRHMLFHDISIKSTSAQRQPSSTKEVKNDTISYTAVQVEEENSPDENKQGSDGRLHDDSSEQLVGLVDVATCLCVNYVHLAACIYSTTVAKFAKGQYTNTKSQTKSDKISNLRIFLQTNLQT